MAIGALLVLLVPLIDRPVLDAVVRWDPGPRLNPLIAAILLFGLPEHRLRLRQPDRRAARRPLRGDRRAHLGRLFAISTAGSIAGTFATAFILIPEFGTNQLLGQCAAVLFAAVAIFAAAERLHAGRRPRGRRLRGRDDRVVRARTRAERTARGDGRRTTRRCTGCAGDAVGADLYYKSAGFDIVYRKDTQYHGLAVVDDETSRYLPLRQLVPERDVQGRPVPDPGSSTATTSSSRSRTSPTKDVLFIGLGGGSAQKQMWRDFKDIHIDVAEIDPVVRDVAYLASRCRGAPGSTWRRWTAAATSTAPTRSGTRSSSTRTTRTRSPSPLDTGVPGGSSGRT